jgi:hypothetical protein
MAHAYDENRGSSVQRQRQEISSPRFFGGQGKPQGGGGSTFYWSWGLGYPRTGCKLISWSP